MQNTFQFQNIHMLKHGEMVFEKYTQLIQAIKSSNQQFFDDIGFPYHKSFFDNILHYQYDLDTMKSYQIYHDCGKHISQYTDEHGKNHFPNHAYNSSLIYQKYFDNIIAQDLILKDLNFHTFSSLEFESWIENENINHISSLFLTALAEILANSTMFGGIESTSFKIKRKKLIQFSKKIQSLFNKT